MPAGWGNFSGSWVTAVPLAFSFTSQLLPTPKSIVWVSGVEGKEFGMITQLCDVFCGGAAWCQNFFLCLFFF